MPPLPMKELKGQISAELSEFILLRHDLQSSMAAIKIWHEKYTSESPSETDKIIGQSLFRDAVVQFVGCFDKTAKFYLKVEDIYQAGDGGLVYFIWLKDIRDAYAAHKFGALRQCVVGVFVDPEQGVVGDGYLLEIYQGPVKEAGPQILAFMRLAAEFLEKKILAMRQTLFEDAKKLTVQQLNALVTARAYGVDSHEARMSRAALQRSRSEKPPVIRS